MSDCRGATIIEYALIAGLVVLGLVLVVSGIGDAVDANYQSVVDVFP